MNIEPYPGYARFVTPSIRESKHLLLYCLFSPIATSGHYMEGLEVRFGSSSTYTSNPVFGTPTTQNVAGEAQVFKPASPMEGRYINVFQAARNYLSICEIEILEA